jgi:5-methylcytosine-specific restriction endonuclease McrA
MRHRRSHSLLYVIYLRSPLWRLRRRMWIVRAGGRCQRCRSRRRLTIHHRTYRRLGHERHADVTVLCRDCHRRQHDPHPASGWRRVFSGRIDTRARAWQHDLSRIGQGSSGHLALLALIAVALLVLATALLGKR